MESLSSYLPLLGVVLVIVSTLAFIYAYYTMNLSKAQIQALRGDRDDLIVRLDNLREELDEVKSLRADEQVEKQELKTQVITLQSLVTHDSKINDLIDGLNAHDVKVSKKYEEYMSSNREILKRIDRLLALEETRHAP